MRFDGLSKAECVEIADSIQLRVKRIEKTYDNNFDSCTTTLTMENDNFETFSCVFCNHLLIECINLDTFQKQRVIKAIDKINATYKESSVNLFNN